MFYKPLYSQLLLSLVFFTFIIGVFPLAAGDTNDKDQNIDPLLAKVYKQKMYQNGGSLKNWMEYAQFGMVKNFIFAAAN